MVRGQKPDFRCRQCGLPGAGWRSAGIFPDDDAIVRLAGPILPEQNDVWAIRRARCVALEPIVPTRRPIVLGLPTAAACSGRAVPPESGTHRSSCAKPRRIAPPMRERGNGFFGAGAFPIALIGTRSTCGSSQSSSRPQAMLVQGNEEERPTPYAPGRLFTPSRASSGAFPVRWEGGLSESGWRYTATCGAAPARPSRAGPWCTESRRP